MDIYEIIGYIGSVLVAVSLTMKNIVKLRWINLFGASTFAAYGLLVEAYPVFLLNGFITTVDIYYLVDMYKHKDSFSLVPVVANNHLYLDKFLDYYKDDIKKYFPTFNKENLKNPEYYFILRNLIPAGLFAYEKISDDTIDVKLDYATPAYQDFKNAKYVYHAESTFLKSKGITNITTTTDVQNHIKYLEKVGYKNIEKDQYKIALY